MRDKTNWLQNKIANYCDQGSLEWLIKRTKFSRLILRIEILGQLN